MMILKKHWVKMTREKTPEEIADEAIADKKILVQEYAATLVVFASKITIDVDGLSWLQRRRLQNELTKAKYHALAALAIVNNSITPISESVSSDQEPDPAVSGTGLESGSGQADLEPPQNAQLCGDPSAQQSVSGE